MTDSSYKDYAKAVLDGFETRGAAERTILFDSVRDRRVGKVLDLGCGPGQDLLPFVEGSEATCVGVDIGAELGLVAPPFFASKGHGGRAHFVRAAGERLPFVDESFDVVLCRVALPYMNNRLTLAEVARVLAPGGTFLLKTHALPFYVGMIARRLRSLDPKQLAYPLICLAASAWHSITGRQLEGGLWRGKEIFQTRSFLTRECARHGMVIDSELPDTNRQTPSFMIVKRRQM